MYTYTTIGNFIVKGPADNKLTFENPVLSLLSYTIDKVNPNKAQVLFEATSQFAATQVEEIEFEGCPNWDTISEGFLSLPRVAAINPQPIEG